MDKCPFSDAFGKARIEKGYVDVDDQNDPVKAILRLKDVRKTAHNWKTFQSGAKPGRIVVPSEEHIRDIRQIPFEVDPPQHGEYRSLVEDWFRRPLSAEYEAELEELATIAVDQVLHGEEVELLSEFSLPLQARALTKLLNVPFVESETFISWGLHTFRSEDNPLDADKANVLFDYLDIKLDETEKNSGSDIYSILLNSEFEGRKLTKEEAKGVMVLTFAGGRDTVINMLTNTLVFLGDDQDAFERLRNEPEILNTAVEEFVRYFSPLTHMGRVVTEDTTICDQVIKKDSRVSLCWASANRDESVFENPNEVILDRKMNPHVGFGFSHHKCLGAHHARQLTKALIRQITKKVKAIELVDFEENIEEWGEVSRKVGYNNVKVKFHEL